MTNNPTALCHVRPYASQSSIQTTNGNSLPIATIGYASSKFTDVFLAHQLYTNLIFVGQLVDNNCIVNFFDLSMVWHRRLGHPNTQILSHVLNSDLPGNKDRSSISLECDSCKLGKSKTLPFPLHASRASHCFDLIHSDVWGPSPVSSHEKFKYYVTFIDDHNKFTWVYFLRSKSEVFRTFTKFLAYVDNQFSTSIKSLRTDSGGEYLSTEFQAFLASKALTVALSNFDIPTCYSHAAKHDCWRQAMQKEIAALKANHTWDIEPYPPTIVPLGCKWVYSVKEYSVNYEETFAPVAKMTIVRTILTLAASSDWPLHHMDVKNVFLHGDLKECIYMKPPSGLFPSPTSHVCKLRCSLYGLKQAPRAWFDKFRTTLLQFSFRQSKYDTSLFLRKSDMGIVVLLVYVDDIVIIGSDSTLLGQLKTHLSESFHMKDLGSLTYFLGLKVHHSPSGISLNQHKYASDLVATAGLQRATSVDTPMELNVKLHKEEGDLVVDPSLYRKLTPHHLHLVVVPRIIHYVQGTSTCDLFFPASNSTCLATYSDADWVGCVDTRRSITSWCVFLGDALISWKSLLTELDFSNTNPTPLHADNTSAIQITTNPIYHERTKHIEVDCHSIREAFEARVINLPHISTDIQIVDIFTKALPRHRHCLLSSKLMLVDQPASI
uniref:Integrase catalytic domain-containing protein n=1 Tax=Vitis vinifera TaxID=29760 RepID=A5AEM2_VITVI|nr:hypothetical protein VITISV_001383 [Vitis vinifera]